jgi:hypothetical protein
MTFCGESAATDDRCAQLLWQQGHPARRCGGGDRCGAAAGSSCHRPCSAAPHGAWLSLLGARRRIVGRGERGRGSRGRCFLSASCSVGDFVCAALASGPAGSGRPASRARKAFALGGRGPRWLSSSMVSAMRRPPSSSSSSLPVAEVSQFPPLVGVALGMPVSAAMRPPRLRAGVGAPAVVPFASVFRSRSRSNPASILGWSTEAGDRAPPSPTGGPSAGELLPAGSVQVQQAKVWAVLAYGPWLGALWSSRRI